MPLRLPAAFAVATGSEAAGDKVRRSVSDATTKTNAMIINPTFSDADDTGENIFIQAVSGPSSGILDCAGHLTPALSPLASDANAEREHSNFAEDKVTGSSTPGWQRPRESQSCAAGTSDAADDATQAEQSSPKPTGPGCGVPGNPAPGGDYHPMNHPARHPVRRLTTAQLEEANNVRLTLEAAMPLLAEGQSQAKVADAVGVSEPWLCRVLVRAVKFKGEQISAAEKCRRLLQLPTALLAKKSPPGRKPKYALTETEAGIVAAHNLQSNRTATAGSPQEALKYAMKRGEIGADSHRLLQERIDEGKPILTEAMRRQVQIGETTVRAYRTPRNAWLNYVQSPGSLQITVDAQTGEERMYEPGEAGTIDDATINLILTVPIERPGDKCWDNFGVMVGRFQFILPADHRSYFIPGFSFTARPRSSYRAEDLTATMHTTFREHGMWREMFLEMGISKARLVHETLRRAGIRIKHVHSPHQKIVELIFNKLWTKLSFLPGQVGRNMTDDEATTRLLMSCRAGATDPRKHFLPLDVVVKALHEVIDEHNAQRINHSRYGKWIPAEFWAAKAPANLRPLAADSEWMFSPVIAAGKRKAGATTSPGIRVNGFNIRTTIQLMEGLSQVFNFQAQWVQQFHGAFVKVFFNPFLDAPAKIVLAQDFQGYKAESILGDAEMVDRHARLNLRKMGYGAFPDIGLASARQNAQALVRVAKSVRPDGKPGVTFVETRSLQSASVVPDQNTAPEPVAPFLRRRAGIGASEEEFNRTAARLQRDELRAAQRPAAPVFIEE